MDEGVKREKAWVGDAVLALFARQWLLAQSNVKPGDRKAEFIALTCNDFLSCFGEPTAIEAKIGVVYENEGLEKAFEFIESEFVPLYRKQQRNRKTEGPRFGRRR